MYPGFDHCDFVRIDVGFSSANSCSVVRSVLWLFRDSFPVGSEILHWVSYGRIYLCVVPTCLQQSNAGVIRAHLCVLLHRSQRRHHQELIPLLRTPPWENCPNSRCRHHPSAHALADNISCGFLHLVLYMARIVIFRWDRANCVLHTQRGAGTGLGCSGCSHHNTPRFPILLFLQSCDQRSALLLVAWPECVTLGQLPPSHGQCTSTHFRYHLMWYHPALSSSPSSSSAPVLCF